MKFLQKQTDKMAYLRGVVRLSKIDGTVSNEEIAYIDAAAKGMNLDEKEISELHMLWTNENNIELKFTNKADAVFFLQEAIQLCSVDGKYDEKEHEELHKIAKEINVAESDVKNIENWVAEGILWRERGETLVKEITERV